MVKNQARVTDQMMAAIIDLDGTMVDTLGDFMAVLGLTLADLGLPPVGREFVARTIGQGTEHLLRSVLGEVMATDDAARIEAVFAQAMARYTAHYPAINGRHADIFPGVAEGLARLRAHGWPRVCLTNKPTAFAEQLLAAKGLREHFAHVFGGDAFARKKPDPLPLLKACEALGLPPAATLMIGDSRNDAQAARAAGCPVMLVTYGYNHGQPVRAVDADGWIERLDELPL
ncbi:MAG: phosphoglycolate phosphatase [Burkholderiales bacterium]|nr:phosphoglycolate phosphatase [Burkholderiales bacterium]